MELQVKEPLKISNIRSDEVKGLDLIKLVANKASVK